MEQDEEIRAFLRGGRPKPPQGGQDEDIRAFLRGGRPEPTQGDDEEIRAFLRGDRPDQADPIDLGDASAGVMETLKGYGDLLRRPMGIVEGGLEFVGGIPHFAGGVAGGAQEVAKSAPFVLTGGMDLNKLYERAARGFEKGHEDVARIIPQYKSGREETALVGETLMSPFTAIQEAASLAASKVKNKNLKGLIKWAGLLAAMRGQHRAMGKRVKAPEKYELTPQQAAEATRKADLQQRLGRSEFGEQIRLEAPQRPLAKLSMKEKSMKGADLLKEIEKEVVQEKGVELLEKQTKKLQGTKALPPAQGFELKGKPKGEAAKGRKAILKEQKQEKIKALYDKYKHPEVLQLPEGQGFELGKVTAEPSRIQTIAEIQKSKKPKPLTAEEKNLVKLSEFFQEKAKPKKKKLDLRSESGQIELELGTAKARHKELMANSPEWQKVHGMVGEKPKASLKEAVTEGLKTANERLLDRFLRLKKVSLKTYRKARTYQSYADVAELKFNVLKGGLHKKVRGQELLFRDYISAHRALNRAERGFKNPNKVTAKDASKTISLIETEFVNRGGKVADLRNSFNNFQKWADKYMLEEFKTEGLISPEAYRDIKKNNKWYATFDVLEKMPEDIHKVQGLSGREFFSVGQQKVIKKIVGTEKLIADPIEATIGKFASAQQAIAKNRVARTFVEDPNTQGMLRRVAESDKEFAILKNSKKNPVRRGDWDVNEFDTINVFRNGRGETYLAPKEIADAMKQLSPKQAPRVIMAINNVFRKSATTLYVPFTISNIMRDSLMAYTTAPVYRGVDVALYAKDLGKGAYEGFKHEFLGKSDLTRQYLEHGGSFGWTGTIREGAGKAKVQLFKGNTVVDIGKKVNPVKFIENVSSAVELAPRLAVFDRALKRNFKINDAAFMAREATIDFNRAGTWTRAVNLYVPFLNARVQSRVVLAQALKKNPKQTLSKAFVSTVVPGMASYAWNKLYYAKEYEDIPEWIKDNYFCTIIGMDKDERGRTVPKYIAIAKGDVGQMAWNPIEFAFEQQWKKDPKAMYKFMVNYLSDISPIDFAREGEISGSKVLSGITPPIAKGIYEGVANVNLYRGKEIEPHWMQKTKPPELRYYKSTPEVYKKLAMALKDTMFATSPLKLQNFASNIFAGYGREGLDPKAMLRGITGRLLKVRGGEIESQATAVYKDIETGYNTARAYAQKAVEDNEPDLARQIISKWNDGLSDLIQEFDDKFADKGLIERGGIRKSFRFTADKRRNILRGKPEDDRSYIEKKLSRR